eukprot:CAMPEP_0177763502 /NCGR_PEP_ID=MMETSP0491_2-20121128/6907_1 /TAXON_ID=63592 /ORGANISM="Tetraselmis chuii, Strain PLY429" /LENGTH=298 /DNA_ID=CAMNT_0019279617 /DNA_START=84 /DNA_END=980 /DNA_ORIENTATION=+
MDEEMMTALLARVGLSRAEVEVSVEGLERLQAAFLQKVPFENQDIHDGRPLDISLTGVYGKLVDRHRGGLCFELNSLFADFLLALGFEAAITPRATMWFAGHPGQPGTHMACVVTVKGVQYLVDVGNGIDVGGAVPISGILSGLRTHGEGASYFVGPVDAGDGRSDDTLGLYIQRGDEPEIVRYSFVPEHVEREGFAPALAYCEGSPDSVFVQKPLATLRTAHGRVSLSKHHLTVTIDGVKRKETLKGPEHRRQLLHDAFGFRPEARIAVRPPRCSALRTTSSLLHTPAPRQLRTLRL